ncbi:MAG: FecR family protein, partial [Massilibacteroides sp.]|nr:FecR family protein [Massilibacteroides sp.]
MKKRNNKEEVEKLLNDDNFLIWCIAPGVVRHGWWLEWLKHSSERAAVVDEAKAIVLSLRINEYTLTDDEIAVMQNNLNKRLKRKRALLRYWSAAAVVLFLFAGASLWFFNDKPFTECRLMEQATINSLSIDEAQTEIELFVRNKEKYLLPNEALIKLQSTGAIKLEEAKIGKIEEKDHIASLKAEKEIPYNTLKVPYGRRSSLTFSDGTKAWVNAGTVLVFPSVFEKKERRIEVSGEIFLEVAKDASRPFFVKTSQIEVKVLGTSFNVTAYPEDQNQSVILVDGQVEIDFGENRSLRLEPDHRAVLSTADA